MMWSLLGADRLIQVAESDDVTSRDDKCNFLISSIYLLCWRSTNRFDKRNFLISSIYLLYWNKINCKEALGYKQGCISIFSIFVCVDPWCYDCFFILLRSNQYIILHDLKTKAQIRRVDVYLQNANWFMLEGWHLTILSHLFYFNMIF